MGDVSNRAGKTIVVEKKTDMATDLGRKTVSMMEKAKRDRLHTFSNQGFASRDLELSDVSEPSKT